MIENFIEYMWYLLTTPLKKLKKALNKWYILCRVFGKRFDEAKEDILRARDEGMVATCSHEMLPVHGADRRLTRYEGEHPENFRSRIAMYEEICKLGGTNEGVLLAVRTLGYTSPVLVRANDLTGFSHFTLDGSWLLDGSRTLESDTIENRWAEFYIVIVMDADEEHPISFDIMRKTVRKWKEVGAKDNYFFKYNLSIRQPHTGNFLEVLYKKHLFYYDYRKLDGMWKLDGSYMLDAEMTPVGTRIGYRYESLYEFHEAGLAVMAYNYACRMVESAILKAAYSFRMYYFEYLKTDGSWTTDGSYVVDAQMSPREMRWSTTFHHQHEEKLLMKQRYRMQPCEEAYSIRKTLEQYRMVIDYFDYLKLNGLWKLTGSRLMDAQRTEYTTKQAYSFGVEHTREFRVIWHEEHNLIFLDGTWSLDGSKIIDAWQKWRYCRMATKSVITKIRRKKMAEASHTTGTVAKITHIALGSGGVNGDGTVIVPLAENVALKKEVVRKPYTSSTKTSDTSYEYTIKLEEDELVGTFISEMALIDEDGDVVAFSNFLAKGKDETEVTFTIEDNY